MNNRPHLILFHHAGGNAASLNMFAQCFKQEFNVTMMEMPGRGRRRLEAFKKTSTQIIDDFAKSIPAEGRLILVGHSLGAYMAYLMAGYYRKEMPNRELNLVVISNEPIHCRQDFSWVKDDKQSRQDLLHFAEQAGQLPDWLKQDETLKQQFLDILTADLKIAESISCEQTQPLDGTPILVIYGEDDPLLSAPPSRWKECTTGQCHIKSILGEHFITFTHENEISELIKQFAADSI